MGLKTPDKIRTFQRKLYFKAKAEPEFRFYLLYDKIYREDILAHAFRLARANGGIAGVDIVNDGCQIKFVLSHICKTNHFPNILI